METDLSIRLHAYATAAERRAAADTSLFTDAISSSRAASVSASAGIICSHTRELRGDSAAGYLRPDQDELDFLVADKPEAGHAAADRLPLRPAKPGHDGLASLAMGAEGIPAIKP